MKLNATVHCEMEWLFLMERCALVLIEMECYCDLENCNLELYEMGCSAKDSEMSEMSEWFETAMRRLENCNWESNAKEKVYFLELYIPEFLQNENLQGPNNFRLIEL